MSAPGMFFVKNYSLLVIYVLKQDILTFQLMSLQPLKSISWHHEGKQFMCSHGDGSLTVWNYRSPLKPQSVMMPHGKIA